MDNVPKYRGLMEDGLVIYGDTLQSIGGYRRIICENGFSGVVISYSEFTKVFDKRGDAIYGGMSVEDDDGIKGAVHFNCGGWRIGPCAPLAVFDCFDEKTCVASDIIIKDSGFV